MKLWRVTMSRGLSPSSSSFRAWRPARRHSSSFPGSSAGNDAENGSDNPRHSMNDDIVFAVYIPPHAPAPGHEWRTISFRSSSVINPASFCPYDWNAETMSSFWSPPRNAAQPARIVPP